MKPTLTLIFDADFGEKYTMRVDLNKHTAEKIKKVNPPIDHSVPWLSSAANLNTFEEVVEIIQTREFRKDLFISECQRLGTLLAERMEDAEGWHDASRIEPAKKALAG